MFSKPHDINQDGKRKVENKKEHPVEKHMNNNEKQILREMATHKWKAFKTKYP